MIIAEEKIEEGISKTRSLQGLSTEEAQRRLGSYGYNEIAERHSEVSLVDV